MKKNSTQRGFTIFFAMLVASLALSIGLAIFDLTIRELDLSQTATQSQFAIYAADTGADCALYWDFKYTDQDSSAFGTSTASSWPGTNTNVLRCNDQDVTVQGPPAVDAARYPGCASNTWCIESISSRATTTFMVNVSAPEQTYCAVVQVAKRTDGNGVLYTTVISRGYNHCTASGITRIERALLVSY